MMCAWKPQRDSDHGGGRVATVAITGRRRSTPGLWRGLALALFAVASCLVLADLALAQNPTLELAPGIGRQVDLAGYLAEDRRWLAGQPAALLHAPAPDSLAAIERWLAAVPKTSLPQAGSGEVAFAEADEAASAAAAAEPATGQRDLISQLSDRWFQRGYLLADVTVTADDARRLEIDPGPSFQVGAVSIGGDDFTGRERLLEYYLPRDGDRFLPADWDRAAEQLLAATGDHGYPFCRWLMGEVEIDPESGTIDLAATLMPGHQSYLGPMSSDLPEGRGERFLIRAAGLREGALFSHEDLQQARKRLIARDLYTEVGEPWLYLTTAVDTVGLHWPVQPRLKTNRLAVVLGLSRREEGGSRVSGQVDLRLPNLAGTGRQLAANWSDDGQQRRVFGFSYLEPLIFGTPLDTDVALVHEVQSESYTRFTLQNNWRLPVVSLWGLELGAGWDRFTYPVGDLQRTARLRGRAAFYHRRGDRRRNGWSGTAAIETARREAIRRQVVDDQTVATGLGEITIQRILEFQLSGEYWLGPVLSLAGRTTFNQLSGGLEPTPLAEQFRFGGTRTLRGYNEDAFHGETVAYGSIELRLGRAGRSRLYTFYDMGYFSFATLTGENGDIRTQREGTARGYGFGLETRTPGGDISLAIGFPERLNFDDAKLHVVLLQAF